MKMNSVWTEETGRTTLIVDLDTVGKNFANIRKSLPGLEVFAVVKADACGTGAERVAKVLADSGADGFAVSCLSEAVPRRVSLEPAMRLVSRLASVRRMKKGSFLGYSRTCHLKEDTLAGLVAAGYADGVPPALSDRGDMLFRGKRCPVLGRISMDYTAISLQEFAGEKELPQVGRRSCSGGDPETGKSPLMTGRNSNTPIPARSSVPFPQE